MHSRTHWLVKLVLRDSFCELLAMLTVAVEPSESRGPDLFRLCVRPRAPRSSLYLFGRLAFMAEQREFDSALAPAMMSGI